MSEPSADTPTVWDAALEAVAERLREVITDVPVETDRRSEPADDEFPLLVVTQEDDEPDNGEILGDTIYHQTIAVSGFHRAFGTQNPETEARRAVNRLRARVVMALLESWAFPEPIEQVLEASCETTFYDAEESALPAGEFTARFTLDIRRATGAAWIEP